MANLVSAHCVADYFLMQVDQNAGDALTNLKLQKLCYYAQAWHLAIEGKPLFQEKIKAWAHGPVIPDVWHRFKEYRWSSIDPSKTRGDPYTDFHSKDLEFLGNIFGEYGKLSGKDLESLTHSEDPWRIAYGDRPLGTKCDEEITHKAMREYYGKKLLEAA